MATGRIFGVCIVIVLVTLSSGESTRNVTRRNGVPVYYARGTNYEVGYDVGVAFKSMILDHLADHTYLNDVMLPKYNTIKGKEVFDSIYKTVKDAYPEYMEEIQGICDGSGADCHKILLLHFDSVFSNNVEDSEPLESGGNPVGCSSLLVNHGKEVFIGHNEDNFPAILNRVYVLCADIEKNNGEAKDERKVVESFCSVCYAGLLPGYTMGFNKKGVVYTINIVEPKVNPLEMMPRHFVSRQLLSARDLKDMEQILKEGGGPGMGDGMSVNIGFYKPNDRKHKLLYNMEGGPGPAGSKASTQVSVKTVKSGETLLHTNRFLRLNITDMHSDIWDSSEHRENRYKEMEEPKGLKSMLNVLGDTTDQVHPFFRENTPEDGIVTALTGAFDFRKGTWSLYAVNPSSGARPVAVLSLNL